MLLIAVNLLSIASPRFLMKYWVAEFVLNLLFIAYYFTCAPMGHFFCFYKGLTTPYPKSGTKKLKRKP